MGFPPGRGKLCSIIQSAPHVLSINPVAPRTKHEHHQRGAHRLARLQSQVGPLLAGGQVKPAATLPQQVGLPLAGPPHRQDHPIVILLEIEIGHVRVRRPSAETAKLEQFPRLQRSRIGSKRGRSRVGSGIEVCRSCPSPNRRNRRNESRLPKP